MKKNVLLIITRLSNGGAERNIALLSERLSKDHNVILAVFDNSKQDYKTDVKIIDLKTPKSKNLIKKIYQAIIRAIKIKKIKKEYNIDCSISFLTSPNFINALTKGRENVVISIRNYISLYKHKFIYYIINKFSCTMADKIVCVAESVKQDQITNYHIDEKKLVTIYNACSLKNEQINIDSKYESDVITIGRLHSQKGQWHLINAFKKVVKKFPEAKLLILGNGKLEKELKNLIEKNNLSKNIEIKNFLNNPYDYLANSKMFVLPSVYEGLSNVILEAMALGLPILATDCYGGNREILHPLLKDDDFINKPLEGEFGILIPNMGLDKNETNILTETEEYLANYIIKLLEDSELRKKYSLKSKERIEFFNEEKNLKEWIEII